MRYSESHVAPALMDHAIERKPLQQTTSFTKRRRLCDPSPVNLLSTFVNLKLGCKPDKQRVLTTCQPILEKLFCIIYKMALEKEATITKKENMYKHHILIPLFTQRTLMHLLKRFSSSRHLSLLITIKKTKKKRYNRIFCYLCHVI
jgi:hypothetical protein